MHKLSPSLSLSGSYVHPKPGGATKFFSSANAKLCNKYNYIFSVSTPPSPVILKEPTINLLNIIINLIININFN